MEESEKKSMISNKYVALFVVGFFVYIALMILIAYLTSRKGSTKGEDYLMGGRNVGLLLLICTAAATAVGTGTSVGGGNPKFCVTAKSGANREKFIMGGRRVKRLPPC